ncbi:MAG: ribosomal-protein-alanine N-acetyltransferase, partial [Streptococcus salivarius]
MRRLTVTTTSSASRLSSQEQAQLIYQILSDVYD